jgi:hypothetical protein
LKHSHMVFCFFRFRFNDLKYNADEIYGLQSPKEQQHRYICHRSGFCSSQKSRKNA